jgi:hypothetical protein
VESSIRLIFLAINYCLACSYEYFNIPSYVVYEISALAWVLMKSSDMQYQIVDYYQSSGQGMEEQLDMYKDLCLATLSLIIGLALFVMKELREAYLQYKQHRLHDQQL